jgi:hypothetical protein
LLNIWNGDQNKAAIAVCRLQDAWCQQSHKINDRPVGADLTRPASFEQGHQITIFHSTHLKQHSAPTTMSSTAFDFNTAYSDFKKHIFEVKSVKRLIDGLNIELEMVRNSILFFQNNVNGNIATPPRERSTLPDTVVPQSHHHSKRGGDG